VFWKWWDEINPPWHIRVNSHPRIGGTGPWDDLHKPGQNGFLSVLQVLCWWQGLLGVEGSEEWNSAVQDVLWVLTEVLNSKSIPYSKHVHKHAFNMSSDIADKSDDSSQAASQGHHSKW
jgi:hypothetical protein